MSTGLTSQAQVSFSPLVFRLDAPGGTLSRVRVRNQRQIGNCYAHVAAQLFDAWRFYLGEANEVHQTSGLELNLRSKLKEGARDLTAGQIDDLVEFINRQGTCSQFDLNEILRQSKKGKKRTTIDEYASSVTSLFVKAREHYHQEIRKTFAIPAENFKSDQLVVRYQPQIVWDVSRYQSQIIFDQAIKELKVINEKFLAHPNQNFKYDHFSPNMSLVDVFDSLGIIQCFPQHRLRSPKVFQVETVSQKRQKDFLKLIYEEFRRGLKHALPVGASICSEVLEKGRAFETKAYDSKHCSGHAVLVAGSRLNTKTGRIQLLIRNSWGHSCSKSYSKDWDCDQSFGSFWIDSDVFERAAYRLTFIKREES